MGDIVGYVQGVNQTNYIAWKNGATRPFGTYPRLRAGMQAVEAGANKHLRWTKLSDSPEKWVANDPSFWPLDLDVDAWWANDRAVTVNDLDAVLRWGTQSSSIYASNTSQNPTVNNTRIVFSTSRLDVTGITNISPPYTFGILCRVTGNNDGGVHYAFGGDNFKFGYTYATGTWIYQTNGGATNVNTGLAVGVANNFVITVESGGVTVIQNGSTTFTSATVPAAASTFRVGVSNDAGGNPKYFAGPIDQLVYVARALNSSERTQLSNYFNRIEQQILPPV